MYTNVVIDFGVGLIPVLGDLVDAWFKCNTRNNILLERYLRERGQKHPAPPPPPPTKQSTIKRWFGTGSNAPASHPPQGTTTADGSTVAAPHPIAPNLPARNTTAQTTGGTKLNKGGAHADLEAQNEGAIHYRREQ